MRFGLVFRLSLTLFLIAILLAPIVVKSVWSLLGSLTSLRRLTTFVAVVLIVLILNSTTFNLFFNGLLIPHMDT